MGNKPQLSREAVDRIRAKIRASELVGRLEEFALGDIVTQAELINGELQFREVLQMPDGTVKRAMTREQIAAAKTLLDKVLPTPQSIDVNTQETKTFVLRAPEPAKDMQTWLKDYGPNRTQSLSGPQTPARKQLS